MRVALSQQLLPLAPQRPPPSHQARRALPLWLAVAEGQAEGCMQRPSVPRGPDRLLKHDSACAQCWVSPFPPTGPGGDTGLWD